MIDREGESPEDSAREDPGTDRKDFESAGDDSGSGGYSKTSPAPSRHKSSKDPGSFREDPRSDRKDSESAGDDSGTGHETS